MKFDSRLYILYQGFQSLFIEFGFQEILVFIKIRWRNKTKVHKFEDQDFFF